MGMRGGGGRGWSGRGEKGRGMSSVDDYMLWAFYIYV